MQKISGARLTVGENGAVKVGGGGRFIYGARIILVWSIKTIWRYTYVWTSMPVTYFEVTFHLLSLTYASYRTPMLDTAWPRTHAV